jgi:hypothetical protein
LNVLTISGVFFQFVGTIEAAYGVLVASTPVFRAVTSPRLLSVLFGIDLITIGTRRKKFSKHKWERAVAGISTQVMLDRR